MPCPVPNSAAPIGRMFKLNESTRRRGVAGSGRAWDEAGEPDISGPENCLAKGVLPSSGDAAGGMPSGLGRAGEAPGGGFAWRISRAGGNSDEAPLAPYACPARARGEAAGCPLISPAPCFPLNCPAAAAMVAASCAASRGPGWCWERGDSGETAPEAMPGVALSAGCESGLLVGGRACGADLALTAAERAESSDARRGGRLPPASLGPAAPGLKGTTAVDGGFMYKRAPPVAPSVGVQDAADNTVNVVWV